jgi:phosphoglycerate dehydrogenase-like enzyme
MKILVADDISERALELLLAEPSWDVVYLPGKKQGSLAEQIQDADALIVRSATKVTANCSNVPSGSRSSVAREPESTTSTSTSPPKKARW